MRLTNIEKRLKLINKEKENISKIIYSEKEILTELMMEDPSWSYFINSNFDFGNIHEIEDNISTEEYQNLIGERKEEKILKEKYYEEDIDTTHETKYYEKISVRVGFVVQEVIFNAFNNVVEKSIPLAPGSELSVFSELDVVILSNLNKGTNVQWDQIIETHQLNDHFFQIISICKEKNIPVIYYDYNGESNSNQLIANECDFVLTNSKERQKQLIKETTHEEVTYFEYAVNPTKYNPVGRSVPKDLEKSILYNGCWDRMDINKSRDLHNIFRGALNAGMELKIIDNKFENSSRKNLFPSKYIPYIFNLEVNSSEKINNHFNYTIAYNENLESDSVVDDSIYRSLAMGNVVFSNYNPAINNKFPNVFIANSQFETTSMLQSMTEKDILEFQTESIRTIMTNENSFERFYNLLDTINYSIEKSEKTILVVGSKQVKEQFENQSVSNAKFIEFKNFNIEQYNNADFIAFLSDNFSYGAYYLEDLINGFKYTNCDFVTKATSLEESFSFTNHIPNLYLTMFCTKEFSFENFKDKIINIDDDKKGFIIDNLEWGKSENLITSKNGDLLDKELSVIIPIYNNGKYLRFKCFQSLKRSSIFDKMEILFIDDGSTDQETIRITNRIEKDYSNVNLFRYTDGGSGSASRPRNKGIELANCKYITYLDPDNEALNDGYAQLLYDIKEDDSFDTIVGNIIRFDKRKAQINYYNHVYRQLQNEIVEDPFQLLIDTNLKVQSIQAMVIKRSLIIDNQLKMVESAAGQDTLFFQEIMTKAQKIKVIDLDIHLYYAAVSNSVTNTISKKFYEKYFKVELERIKFLNNNNLLDVYIDKKFQFYFENWYLKRLIDIKQGDERKAIKILTEIYDMYAPYLQNPNKTLKKFKKLAKNKEYNLLLEYLDNHFNL